MDRFLSGFEKRAQDSSVPMLKWNHLGGVEPTEPQAMARAQAANLLTLPKELDGASCESCQFYRNLDEKMGKGFCTNPDVQTDVTPRMHCVHWDSAGSEPVGSAEDLSDVASQNSQIMQPTQEAAVAQEEPQPIDQPQTDMPPAEGAPEGGKGVPPSKGKSGHTININVGKEKQASVNVAKRMKWLEEAQRPPERYRHLLQKERKP